jgi:hypothetical protein
MNYEFDIALSFAGEDREYVEQVAEILKKEGIKVFYDKFEESELWGKDLGIHFEFVYRRGARFCIPFVSKHYKEKLWTNYEIRNAISRAIETKEEYILPARFDDTEIEGLRTSVAYINLQNYTPEKFAAIILRKLNKAEDEPVIITSPKEVANIYLSQNLLVYEGIGVDGVSLGVTITNITKEHRYYNEPYFKLSNGIEGKYDTFFLANKMVFVQFPQKMEWGQPLTVNYLLKPAGVNQWRSLPDGTTIKAIVTTTIGEIFESNEIEISNILKYF